MTAGAKLPWQVASAVCVRGLQVAVASCDRCMCGIMAGCYRNLRSPYVRGLKIINFMKEYNMNFVSKYYTRSETRKFAIIPLEIIHSPTKVANVILFCNFHG